MTVILGIDAAWTTTRPSGVAVVAGEPGHWRLVAVTCSYGDFYRRAGLADAEGRFEARLLLDSASRLAGERVGLVAADIPLAHSPMAGRRESDNAVSRLYGGRHAATHSPSAARPGVLADQMRSAFATEGYQLQTAAPAASGLIEVYPHPALIELMSAPRRLPYKTGKSAKYWPDLPAAERRNLLLAQWRDIVGQLDRRIQGVAARLPLPAPDASGVALKAYEDALDAVVCGWIGTCVIEGRATALGDSDSAIWIPTGDQ
jgi:predicted RNase H-like nuclease